MAKKGVPAWALAIVAVLIILNFVLGCYNAVLINPEIGLPETLTDLSNKALRNHGRNERVSRTEGLSCQISESWHRPSGYDRIHYCTAKAFFSDGHTSEICIYRRFQKHSKHGGEYELYMTVNLCEEYPDIEVTERFRYMSIFYDFDSDLTAEGNEPAAVPEFKL